MCFVERLPHGDKTNGPRPKAFFGIAFVVSGQARLDRVALANVEPVTLAILTRRQQQVHAGLLQLGPMCHTGLRHGQTRKHQRTAHPIGPLDDAQAIRVAVSDEDAEGERLKLHLRLQLCNFLQPRTSQKLTYCNDLW